MAGATRPAGRLIVLAGPSGVGMSSVVRLVRARLPELFVPLPTTTRPLREPERAGVHYHYLDRGRFAELVSAGELLEWAQLGRHWYGTTRASVTEARQAGRPVLLALDPAGAVQVRAAMPDATLVWLASPGRPRGPAGWVQETTIREQSEFDLTVTVDSVVRAADRLVGLLGSPALL